MICTNKLSFEEYLRLEQTTNRKYEYHDGLVFPSGQPFFNKKRSVPSTAHNRICGNAYSDIDTILEQAKSAFLPFMNAKLYLPKQSKHLYPDLSVICDKEQVAKYTISNPSVIIEVLSDSTTDYDRGDKFHFYRSILSLREYVLISQDKVQVEVFERRGELWEISQLEGLGETLVLPSIGVEVSLARIYRNVAFLSQS
jgi:Uma2 family endonuclease